MSQILEKLYHERKPTPTQSHRSFEREWSGKQGRLFRRRLLACRPAVSAVRTPGSVGIFAVLWSVGRIRRTGPLGTGEYSTALPDCTAAWSPRLGIHARRSEAEPRSYFSTEKLARHAEVVPVAWKIDPTKVLGGSDSRLRGVARSLLVPTRPVESHESAVVALECPATAALCFDRVWSISPEDCPDPIRFTAGSDAELLAAFVTSVTPKDPSDFPTESDLDALAQAFLRNSLEGLPEGAMRAVVMLWCGAALLPDGSDFTAGVMRGLALTVCQGVRGWLGRPALPVFSSEQRRDAEYVPGDREVVLAALRELDVVDEDELTWEQVLAFRQDSAARRDYRRLVHWLDSTMVSRQHTFIVDELGKRIELYRQALRKHGLKTRLGVLASLVDAKALVGTSAAASASLVSGHPLWGLLAATSILFGKALLTIGQARIDLEEVHNAHSEIAFVAQVNERLTSAAE